MIEKIRKLLFDIANWICTIAIVGVVIVLLIVVIGRYFFQFTPSWSEETALFLLTWIGLFSSCIAEYHGTHVRVSVIDNAYPPEVLRVLGIIRWFLKIIFFALMTYFGFKIFTTTQQRFGAINLSYKWQVLPGIFTGIFSLVFAVTDAKRVFMDKHENDAQKNLEMLMDE